MPPTLFTRGLKISPESWLHPRSSFFAKSLRINPGVLPSFLYSMFLLFLHELILIAPMSNVMTDSTQANQVIIIQCQFWVISKFLYMMDFCSSTDFSVSSVQHNAFLYRFLDSCSAILTFMSVSIENINSL